MTIRGAVFKTQKNIEYPQNCQPQAYLLTFIVFIKSSI